MAVGYAKLLDKARKLKALADRGNEGEQDSAKKFYSDFIKKNNISEKEVDSERLNRIFKLRDTEYEIIVSYIIMSVNPFCEIKRLENGAQFMVALDDEDYIEAEYKFSTFHSLFKKEEKRIISHYKSYGEKKYEREKLILITAFLGVHKIYFQPDEYAVKKNKGDNGRKVNPEMAQSVKNANNDESLQEKIRKAEEDYKKNKHKYDQQQQEVITFNEDDMKKIQLYSDMLTPTYYVRANKTLTEPQKSEKKKKIKQ